MGNEKNITSKTFEEAAVAAGETLKEAKKNVFDALKKEMEIQEPEKTNEEESK